uniref:Uncharacterized protein n=1 Tax=Arundo donax TaxID=35708 RepID=A0A0A8ZWX5_ARUDO
MRMNLEGLCYQLLTVAANLLYLKQLPVSVPCISILISVPALYICGEIKLDIWYVVKYLYLGARPTNLVFRYHYVHICSSRLFVLVLSLG